MFPAQEPHVSRVRDARTKSLRFPKTKQIQSLTIEVYQTDTTASSDCIAKAEGG